jgi:tripartite-type tricarboxylate transporter receptor subunit TctC
MYKFISLLLLISSLSVAHAQPSNSSYPNRPIKLINPLGTGGTAETLARTAGRSLTDQLGQPVIVETKTGAAGTI